MNEPLATVQTTNTYKNKCKQQYLNCKRSDCPNFKNQKVCIKIEQSTNPIENGENVFSIYIAVNHVNPDAIYSDCNISTSNIIQESDSSNNLVDNQQHQNGVTASTLNGIQVDDYASNNLGQHDLPSNNNSNDDLYILNINVQNGTMMIQDNNVIIDTTMNIDNNNSNNNRVCQSVTVKTREGETTPMITGIYYKIQKNADNRFIYGVYSGNKIRQCKEEEVNDKEGEDEENMLWTLIEAEEDEEDGFYYRIKKKRDQRVIDGVRSDREIVLQPEEVLSPDNQLWQMVVCKRNPAYFRLKKKGNGRVIDGWEDFDLINQQSDDEEYHTNRLWRFVPHCKLHATVTDFLYSQRVELYNTNTDKFIRERCFDNTTDQETENESTFDTNDAVHFTWRVKNTDAIRLCDRFSVDVLLAPPNELRGFGFGPGFAFALNDQTEIRTSYEHAKVSSVSEKMSFRVKPRTRKRVRVMFNEMASANIAFKAKIHFNVRADRLGADGKSVERNAELDPALAKYLLEENRYYCRGRLQVDDVEKLLYSEIEGEFNVKCTHTILKLDESQLESTFVSTVVDNHINNNNNNYYYME